MAVEKTHVESAEYSTLFRTFVERSTRYVLREVQAADSVPPAESRDQALHTLNYALALPDAWAITRELLLALAPKMEQAGARDDWMSFLRYGLHESVRHKDTATEAELHFHLGVLYQHQTRYQEAREHFATSAEQFEAIGDLHRQARAINRTAYVARLQGHLREARTFVEQARALLDDNNVTERAYNYLVLGTVALDERDWQRAHRHFEASLRLWEDAGDTRYVAWALTNLGTTFRRLEQYDDAVECYRRAIGMFEEIHDPVHRAAAQMNLGNVHLTCDEFTEALSWYGRAESVFREVHDVLRLAMVQCNIGIAYRCLQQWKPADRAYRASIAFWEEAGNERGRLNAMNGLGRLYVEQGRPEEAVPVLRTVLRRLESVESRAARETLCDDATTLLAAIDAQIE